ncbi:MAG: transcriptional regulator [Nitrosopumilus sp.]|nr:transcriptional regulator [Nitrosopumilus sp.]CAI9832096.1 conserved hypothetical protein [Nitrosopumilaceae archaeon]MDA7941405.1 transcriptional regulator [Nitrosopumilus sp.]MDA7942813.1 transcriptional regulator [Nitrosopumilus sp.]MDA7945099.1 transcriptional regulator [Nitrosopumilus sp.]
MAYRTQMRIIGQILETAQENQQDGNGASVTYLIRKANVPHQRLRGLLGTLVSQGLLERSEYAGAQRYKISMSGREFLRAYYSFAGFAESFGLSI